jgi:hypothetical protein
MEFGEDGHRTLIVGGRKYGHVTRGDRIEISPTREVVINGRRRPASDD